MIKNIGVNIYENGLFEAQYNTPNGMAYNSYLLFDEKICLFDTADIKATDKWLENLTDALQNKQLDYLVISHAEPDHSYNIKKVIELFPNVKIVGNMLTFRLIEQFYHFDLSNNKIVVKDGDSLSLGKMTLTFYTAPMVHWPEVMLTYESSTKTLFSADAFGKFGTTDCGEGWSCEARRYYFNIIGKYGDQVQATLKKLGGLDIQHICPLHGPEIFENIEYYFNLYNIWSSYAPEKDGVFIAYSSVYGNTKSVAEKLYQDLKADGVDCQISNLTTSDMSENIENAFKYSKLVIATTTYENNIFPVAEEFVAHLKQKDFKNRTIGIIENGSWAPAVARVLKAKFAEFKNIKICNTVVSMLSAPSQQTFDALAQLKEELKNN